MKRTQSKERRRRALCLGWLVLVLVVSAWACRPKQGVATLSWDAVDADQIIGYNVYRADNPDDEFERITGELVREPRYVDRTVQRGKTYHYRVTSVSASGLESDPSAPASKTVE